MSLFSKQKRPTERPFTERAAAFRSAIHKAAAEHDIGRADLISICEDIVDNERMAIAFTAPLPSASPRVYSGNIPEPATPIRDLARRIAGIA